MAGGIRTMRWEVWFEYVDMRGLVCGARPMEGGAVGMLYDR